MAPSNLSQVFINNAATMLTTGAFSQTAAASSSSTGIWNLGLTTPAYGTNLLSSGVIQLNAMQFTQTMKSGNCIASPIIEKGDIKRIAYSTYKATVAHAVTLTAATVTAPDFVSVKIAIRTMPTAYAYYANPNNPDLDLSGDGKVFPLLGNFSAGRTIIPVDQLTGSNTANATALAATINNNATLSKIFKATVSSADVTITARHAGVVFDVVTINQDGDNANWAQNVTEFEAGVGNYWQVLSDELSHRAKYGNFNRMYFPMDFTTFADASVDYDVVEISYAHAHPADTGIARAAELNNVKLYLKTAQALIATEIGVTFPATGVTSTFVY